MFNKHYRQEFEAITDVMTVPVTTFAGEVVVGYNRSLFEQAIGKLQLD